MKYASCCVLGFLVAVVARPGHSQARPDTPPKIDFEFGQPLGGNGQITAKGKFSLGDNAALAIDSVTLKATPVQGGKEYADKNCKWSKGSWSGVISDVPAGEYQTRAEIVVKDGPGKKTNWATPFKKVTVRAAQPVAKAGTSGHP